METSVVNTAGSFASCQPVADRSICRKLDSRGFRTVYLQSKIPSPDGKAVYMARNGSPFFTWTGMDTHAEDNQ